MCYFVAKSLLVDSAGTQLKVGLFFTSTISVILCLCCGSLIESLQTYFSQFGTVVKSEVMYDEQTKKPR